MSVFANELPPIVFEVHPVPASYPAIMPEIIEIPVAPVKGEIPAIMAELVPVMAEILMIDPAAILRLGSNAKK